MCHRFVSNWNGTPFFVHSGKLNLGWMNSEGYFSGALMMALMALLRKSIIPNGSKRRRSGALALLGGVYYSNYAAFPSSSVGVWYILTKQMSCLSPLAHGACVHSPGFYLFRLCRSQDGESTAPADRTSRTAADAHAKQPHDLLFPGCDSEQTPLIQSRVSKSNQASSRLNWHAEGH